MVQWKEKVNIAKMEANKKRDKRIIRIKIIVLGEVELLEDLQLQILLEQKYQVLVVILGQMMDQMIQEPMVMMVKEEGYKKYFLKNKMKKLMVFYQMNSTKFCLQKTIYKTQQILNQCSILQRISTCELYLNHTKINKTLTLHY